MPSERQRLRLAIILQFLLLGVTAHINLDLGIATAATMKGQHMPLIRGDFDRMFAIKKAMVDKVQDNLGKVSPLMGLLDMYSKTHDELLVDFGIVAAREGTWWFAQELSQKAGVSYEQCITNRDNRTAVLASRLASPSSFFLKLILYSVRASEGRTPGASIQILSAV